MGVCGRSVGSIHGQYANDSSCVQSAHSPVQGGPDEVDALLRDQPRDDRHDGLGGVLVQAEPLACEVHDVKFSEDSGFA
jgi:hypothetical protein